MLIIYALRIYTKNRKSHIMNEKNSGCIFSLSISMDYLVRRMGCTHPTLEMAAYS